MHRIAVNLTAKIVQNSFIDIADINRERNSQFIPRNDNLRRIVGYIVKVYRHRFLKIAGHRFRRHAQSILFCVVIKTAPFVVDFVENNRPTVFCRKRVQAVFTFRQDLPVDFHFIGNFKSRIFIRARAPNFVVWN